MGRPRFTGEKKKKNQRGGGEKLRPPEKERSDYYTSFRSRRGRRPTRPRSHMGKEKRTRCSMGLGKRGLTGGSRDIDREHLGEAGWEKPETTDTRKRKKCKRAQSAEGWNDHLGGGRFQEKVNPGGESDYLRNRMQAWAAVSIRGGGKAMEAEVVSEG